jgi:hypothetical protein
MESPNHVSLTGPEGYRNEGRRKKEEGREELANEFSNLPSYF